MKAYLPKTYAQAVTELALRAQDPVALVQALFRTLQKHKAMLLLPYILQEVRQMALTHGKQAVSIVVARPALEQVIKHIGQLVKKQHGATTPVSYSEDHALIGGFSMQYGDDVTDYSLKTLLQQLHSSIDTKIV